MRGRRVTRNAAFTALGVVGFGAVVVAGSPPTAEPDIQSRETPTVQAPYRAFEPDSWWNSPLPFHPPLDPAQDEILHYLSTADESGPGCLRLAGAGDSPWGQPIYWANPGDPVFDVQGINHSRPPELDSLRIPTSAVPAANNDSTMTIFDRDKGYVVALTDAQYDHGDWSATGATVTYLDSNGLNVATGQSDDARNLGAHRGNNGATMAVRWDMVRAGLVPHVLKIASGPELADRAVFPMVGSDGDYTGSDPAVPPEGIRLRIKPSIDLSKVGLQPQALVIARALQRYGAYIGDSGGSTALKLENTVAEGRGQLWTLTSTDLCGLPFEPKYWEVVAEGYDPSQGQ